MGMVIARVDEEVKQGDIVTLIGDKIPMREVARYLGTSVYEAGCMLNDWIPRKLIKDGKALEIEERGNSYGEKF